MDLNTGAKIGAAMIVVGTVTDMAGLFLAEEIARIGATSRRWVFAIGTALFLVGTSLVIFSPDFFAASICAAVLMVIAAVLFGTIIKVSDSEEPKPRTRDLRNAPIRTPVVNDGTKERRMAAQLDLMRASKALHSEKRAAPASASPVRDTWLQQAVAYAIYGHWPREDEEIFGRDNDLNDMTATIERMRELAHEGSLHIWGRTSPNSLPVLIEQTFWVDYQISLMSLWGPPETPHTEPATHLNAKEYQALMVSRAEIEALWPAPAAPEVITLQSAAQIAYEQAEKDGWLHSVVSKNTSPQLRLDYFKHAMLIQAQHHAITLSGKEPPSTQSYPIPVERLSGLHPVAGKDALHYLMSNQIIFDDVTITREDLDKVIATYQALAMGL